MRDGHSCRTLPLDSVGGDVSRLTNTAGEACSGGAQEILPIFANTRVTSWGGNQRLCIPKGAGAEAATAERMGRAARSARAARAAARAARAARISGLWLEPQPRCSWSGAEAKASAPNAHMRNAASSKYLDRTGTGLQGLQIAGTMRQWRYARDCVVSHVATARDERGVSCECGHLWCDVPA